MALLMFILLVGLVVNWGFQLVTASKERAAFAKEFRASPARLIAILMGVAGTLTFGFGVLFPALGTVHPFGAPWPLWGIGGAIALVFLVLDWTVLDRL